MYVMFFPPLTAGLHQATNFSRLFVYRYLWRCGRWWLEEFRFSFCRSQSDLATVPTQPSTQAFSSSSLESTWCEMTWRHRLGDKSRRVVWSRRGRLGSHVDTLLYRPVVLLFHRKYSCFKNLNLFSCFKVEHISNDFRYLYCLLPSFV